MSKKLITAFVGACLVLCLIPSLCMIFAKSDEVIGNETAVSFPQMTDKEGKVNYGILGDMGTWFERHFAFRPQLITADAKIQTGLFQTSNTDTVAAGNNGWLYYSSTLDDYLGKNVLSARGKWCLAHNMKLVENYVEGNGAKFLFIVPPNKNTLYGENMPYYYKPPEEADHNRTGLADLLSGEEVSYLDLFKLFEEQDEVLYLSQDSHWNNKGALMVYNASLDQLGKEHEDYSEAAVTRADTHHGDLAAMIYPADTTAERDYTYDYEPRFEYLITAKTMSDTVSVEDFYIEAENTEEEGTLLMYRDSFGNTLIPFMANAFGKSVFSKTVPYNLVGDMGMHAPDYVVIEKVERNLRDFVKEPAVIPAPAAGAAPSELKEIGEAEVTAEQCMANMMFVAFKGTLPEGCAKENGRIYLGISDAAGHEMVYETFTTVTEDSDYGFLAYLPMERFGDLSNINTDLIKVYTEA